MSNQLQLTKLDDVIWYYVYMFTWLREYHPSALPFITASFTLLALGLYSPQAEPATPVPNIDASQAKKDPEPVPAPPELPGGGRALFPDYRLIALYGSPDAPALGVLGEQPIEQSIARTKQLAAEYQAVSPEKIMPTFEIITTVAADEPTHNGDYSRELEVEKILPWVDAAEKAGVYVVLDLQPGHSDFLSQAKLYEELLKRPHVGLALDPEWRLGPGQQHMVDIGSVGVAEVNQTATWLADLTSRHNLPQKLFLLHQFKLDMITDRHLLDTSRKELAYLVQMDGNGSRAQKQDTWQALLLDAPAGLHFGWKNFYDEDEAMLSPAETMQVAPAPWFVSYQ